MSRCQVELGLRVGDVAALRLEDLDWCEGILPIASSTRGRARELALSEGSGGAGGVPPPRYDP